MEPNISNARYNLCDDEMSKFLFYVDTKPKQPSQCAMK
jgi:hypothetical protein